MFIRRDSLRGVKLYETVDSKIDEIWNEYQGDYKKEFKELKKPVKNRLKYEYSRIYFNSEYENYLNQILSEEFILVLCQYQMHLPILMVQFL